MLLDCDSTRYSATETILKKSEEQNGREREIKEQS